MLCRALYLVAIQNYRKLLRLCPTVNVIYCALLEEFDRINLTVITYKYNTTKRCCVTKMVKNGWQFRHRCIHKKNNNSVWSTIQLSRRMECDRFERHIIMNSLTKLFSKPPTEGRYEYVSLIYKNVQMDPDSKLKIKTHSLVETFI